MNRIFISSLTSPAEQSQPAYWFIFRGNQLLVTLEEDRPRLPYLSQPSAAGLATVRHHYLGCLTGSDNIHCYAAEVAEGSDVAEGVVFQGLRHLYGRLDEDLLWLGGRAFQIIEWDRTHQFCGRCGAPTEMLAHERAKQCPQCGLTSYPRISPAIIVRVERIGERGSELLLARSQRHPAGLYSVLAGFVEPGETLEECVRREIKEEVGIDVKNIAYFGSQPWPFPNSLMIAFTADYAGGDLVLEDSEIHEAAWFTADALPTIPPPMSIARRLIDDFVARNTQ
jgi:NAD+ diphosphatase